MEQFNLQPSTFEADVPKAECTACNLRENAERLIQTLEVTSSWSLRNVLKSTGVDAYRPGGLDEASFSNRLSRASVSTE
jgi:hypothetical protein